MQSKKLAISDKILVVDDSHIILSIVHKTVSALTPNPIVQARHGQEAFNLVKELPELFKVVFLDLSMPVMGGVEFVQQVRSLKGDKADTTIIAVTGNQKNLSEKELLSIGLNGVIMKPISFENVFRILSSLPLKDPTYWFGVI